MNRTRARFALVGLACFIAFARTGAQGTSDSWYGLQPKSRNFDPPKVFTGAFEIQLPKDWHLAPGHTGTIFSVVEHTKKWETGGLITLEYMRLQAPLDPSDSASLAQTELKNVQNRELSGKQFSGVVKTAKFGPLIFVQYDRPGISGRDDHVAQYSMPIGLVMYRLICVAPSAAIETYRPIFAHVSASFSPVKGG